MGTHPIFESDFDCLTEKKMSLDTIFAEVETVLNANQEKRESIRDASKELESAIIKVVQIVRRIHQGDGEVINSARAALSNVPSLYASIGALVPAGCYFKFHDVWRITTSKCCFVLSFLHFIETGALITRASCAEQLGIAPAHGESFHLELEDYLIGLLDTCSELARLAPNSVVNGDNDRPAQIHKFLCDIAEGYAQLNLKNDRLRKRFDCLKYDVQKVENVIYDLQVRGVTAAKRKVPNKNENAMKE